MTWPAEVRDRLIMAVTVLLHGDTGEAAIDRERLHAAAYRGDNLNTAIAERMVEAQRRRPEAGRHTGPDGQPQRDNQ